jgi:hypothetical protein
MVAQIKAQEAEDAQEATTNAAKAGELHDVNPWLRMTRWARYLDGVNFDDMLDVSHPSRMGYHGTSGQPQSADGQALREWNPNGGC